MAVSKLRPSRATVSLGMFGVKNRTASAGDLSFAGRPILSAEISRLLDKCLLPENTSRVVQRGHF